MHASKFINGQEVVLKLKDAVSPDLADMIRAIGPELRVTGNVVFFSDGCDRENCFAIVEVAGMHTPLIVPVDCLESAARTEPGQPLPTRADHTRKAC